METIFQITSPMASIRCKSVRDNSEKRPVKTPFAYLRWKTWWILTVIGFVSAAPLSRAADAGQKAAEETRRSLRQQGFKTDLADFDFSTSPQLRAREAILKATQPSPYLPPHVLGDRTKPALQDQRPKPFTDHPDLMEALGTNTAIVGWKMDSPEKLYPQRRYKKQRTWEQFHEAVNVNKPQIDDACAAILSDPIRFTLATHRGRYMLLPHLAMLNNLTQMLGTRTVLNLHDGNLNVAWTNLMAATRLVTVWEPEPVEVSHLVRFADTSLAFNAIWQALQTSGWSDEQLAQLQTEWQSADFFIHLPETAAFNRAKYAALCRQEGRDYLSYRLPLKTYMVAAMQFPPYIWSELNMCWDETIYHERGAAEDEKAMLLFYRDRELELRNAVQAPTWLAMRKLPGVMETARFQSKYQSFTQIAIIMQETKPGIWTEDFSLLGRAAVAEAQRRLIITAIALERYHGKFGSYPKNLSDLAPTYLKNQPVDFMDGQPLRYRLSDDGHFLLYSVSLDCVDHGGQISHRGCPEPTAYRYDICGPHPKGDIVWPLSTSPAAAEASAQAMARP
jgi:hypothetical protein